ncbi:hypothetical protein [Salmonella phage SP01]|uniref:Lipoprotein n=1 Tax=Salmonella phage SP01 TaxID=1920294 RepID=A0A291NKY6_9CAUD|nr:Rz-like spanin [Salmonella phage SP01]ATI99488.1 hypothetical protein [Salmonella phage SP01]
MKKLILLSVLLLAGCNPFDKGIRIQYEDIKYLCEQSGGVINTETYQIGVSKGIVLDTVVITQTCDRTPKNKEGHNE